MDISDEIVFPIYDEMHLNHGKLEIKCTGNWPNLIVADGMVFTPMCTYGDLIANHIVMNMQRQEFKAGIEEIQVPV
jgi:hypothetical protein